MGKILYAFSIEPDQLNQLRELSKKTHVGIAEYIRQGVQIILKRENKNLSYVEKEMEDSDWSK